MKRDVLLIASATLASRVAFVGVLRHPRPARYRSIHRGGSRLADSGAGLLTLFAWSEGRSPLIVALIAGLQSRSDDWRVRGLVSGGGAFRDDVVRVAGASFVIAFGLFHTATWSEGDHRFLAPVLPAVYLLAGRAIDRLFRIQI